NAYCMTVFDKHLYIGTFNDYSGCEVWRTDGSLNEGGPEMNWETVNYGGFKSSGSGAANICVMDMVVYKDSLYAGTHNRCWGSGYTTETQWSAGRIFRFAPNQNDSRNWDLVWDGVVNPGGDPPKYALAARCFTEFQNKLYVGLFHDSGHDIFNSDGGSWTGVSNIDGENVSDVIDLINFCDTNEDPPTNHMYATAGQGTSQLVWRTADGMNWEERSEVGFGDENNESLFCFGTFGKAHEFNALYVGTWNNTDEDGTGTEIWQTPKPDSDCTYITLTSFDAAAQKDGSIMLRWETGTELGSAGFHLYRSESPDFRSFERITQKMIPARGSAAEGAVYRALDKSVEPGTLYYYFLVEIDANGKMSTFGPVQARAKVPIPETFEMYSAIIQMDTNGV
ncbi:MAG: hypothetical protein JW941_13155, partial [Candidatus Coatesbacteria bacterium]|nr:hypothetical protein [Candidatus Coatesbacteria bacterium]